MFKQNMTELSPIQLLGATVLFYFLSYVANKVMTPGIQVDLVSGGLGTIGIICFLLFFVSLGRKLFKKEKK